MRRKRTILFVLAALLVVAVGLVAGRAAFAGEHRDCGTYRSFRLHLYAPARSALDHDICQFARAVAMAAPGAREGQFLAETSSGKVSISCDSPDVEDQPKLIAVCRNRQTYSAFDRAELRVEISLPR